MSGPNTDDLADALAKLASGEVAPSAIEPAPLLGESPDGTPGKYAPESPETTGRPAGAFEKISRAPMPADLAPIPIIPTIAPKSPYAPASDAPASFAETWADEDRLDIPPEQLNVPAPTPSPSSLAAAQRAAMYQTLEFRRTMIPVLLVCGMLMIVFAVSKFVVGAESPLSALPGSLTAALFFIGLFLLVLAVLNMLSVRDRLNRR